MEKSNSFGIPILIIGMMIILEKSSPFYNKPNTLVDWNYSTSGQQFQWVDLLIRKRVFQNNL